MRAWPQSAIAATIAATPIANSLRARSAALYWRI